jgi:hypothetical protein
LKKVQVEHQHRERALAPLAAADQGTDVILEEAPVVEAGHRVAQGVLAQVLHQALGFQHGAGLAQIHADEWHHPRHLRRFAGVDNDLHHAAGRPGLVDRQADVSVARRGGTEHRA